MVVTSKLQRLRPPNEHESNPLHQVPHSHSNLDRPCSFGEGAFLHVIQYAYFIIPSADTNLSNLGALSQKLSYEGDWRASLSLQMVWLLED